MSTTPAESVAILKRLPRLTLGLALLLSLIFVVWHSVYDIRHQKELDNLYITRLLPIEWPQYGTTLLERREGSLLKTLEADYAKKDYVPLARQMGADQQFEQTLADHGKDYLDTDTYGNWVTARDQFTPEHRELSQFALGLDPQLAHPITFFTYQLVPQHVLTFIPSLLLLLAAGLALELTLGGGIVIAGYVLGGVVGGIVFVLLSGYDVMPLATISVGTSALVGLALMQFRHEREPVRGIPPATAVLVLVALWVAKEGLEVLVEQKSVIQLLPHLAGFATGIGVWFAHRKWFQHSSEVVVLEHVVDPGESFREQLDQAMKAIGQFNFSEARKRLRELVTAYPQSLRAIEQLYQLEKLEPANENFELVTRRLFSLSNTDEASYVALRIYRDYARLTQTQQALDTETTLKLIMRFSRIGEVKEAENLMKLVISRGDKHNLLPKAALALSQAFERLQDPARANFYKEMTNASAAAAG